jgi:hypothetical protein
MDLLGIGNLVANVFTKYFPPDMPEEAKAQMQAEVTAMIIAANTQAEQELTKRLQADMASDSWLSKNVRPLVLVFLLAIYTIFAGFSVSFKIDPVYLDMLKQMLMAAFGFYFVSRGVEKVTDKIVAGWGKR